METIIKSATLSLLVGSALLCSACDTSSSDHKEEAEKPAELQLNQKHRGVIDEVGQVDWAHYKVGDQDSVLSVKLSNETLRADIELLGTIYQQTADGKRVRLYADHGVKGSKQATDIKMNVRVEANSDIYIAVRDLMDDAATDNPYFLRIDATVEKPTYDSFEDAKALVLDETENCPQEKIEAKGDIDSYSFEISTAGIYKVNTEFNESQGSSAVDLYLKLYSSDGNLIDSLQKHVDNNFPITRYFSVGTYYLLVQDYGHNDDDPANFYSTCISAVESEEANGNESAESATVLSADSEGRFQIAGSLDHLTDQDWYQVPAASTTGSDLQIIDLNFSTTNSKTLRAYLIELVDVNGQVLFSHQHNPSSSGYHVQMKVAAGQHFIKVSSDAKEVFTVAAPYSALVSTQGVSDDAETGTSNDDIDKAIALSATSTDDSGWTEGKIAYRGDDDWYSVTFNRDQHKVMEVYLETDAPSEVDYRVVIVRDDVAEKSMSNANGMLAATSLKTSILVNAVDSNDEISSSEITYKFKVSDGQANDSDGDNAYRIRVNVVDIPQTLAANPEIVGKVNYFNEVQELQDNTATEVTLLLRSNDKLSFKANTQLLDFDGYGEAAKGQFTKIEDGSTTTFSSEWVAGYIDYQDDQDWFQIDLQPLYVAIENLDTKALVVQPQDEKWYYDIKVEFFTAAPGSSVEYIWKFYKDGQQNFKVVDATTKDNDGYFASAGDDDILEEGYRLTTPEADEKFWLNESWKGHFFFNVSDLNLIASKLPDADWGYDQPYYFKISLVYHSGISREVVE